jgi:hypothetical protein
MNKIMYNKFKFSDIITVRKVCRLEWLGHVVGVDREWPVGSGLGMLWGWIESGQWGVAWACCGGG